MPCWSRSVVFLACACIHSVALAGARNCNVQCMFYYSGYEGCKNVEDFKWESFLETPVYPTTHEELFPSLKEFRTLNLKLCRLECFAANSDGVNVSNAVEETSRFLEDMARGPGEGFIDRALESVAFSIVRIQQRRSGLLLDIPAIERLLPDHLLEGDDMPMSLKTFKRMVIIARLVEKYRAEHWSLPVVLDEAGIPALVEAACHIAVCPNAHYRKPRLAKIEPGPHLALVIIPKEMVAAKVHWKFGAVVAQYEIEKPFVIIP